MSLALRNLLFTIVVPGAGGVYVPWLIVRGESPAAWYAIVLIALGAALYVWCVWEFAAIGRGTPGLWDAPRRVVAAGPYRWVRNPIYIAAVLIVSGEAWLFLSVNLLLYTAGLAVACHLIVVGYEEPRLRARFGEPYEEYRHTVSRWVPHRPRSRHSPSTAAKLSPMMPASLPSGIGGRLKVAASELTVMSLSRSLTGS
jgi:protein-S-isoprenylcysteine O-methyltransferase Ste14